MTLFFGNSTGTKLTKAAVVAASGKTWNNHRWPPCRVYSAVFLSAHLAHLSKEKVTQ